MGATTLSITTINITKLTTHSNIQLNDTQHNDTWYNDTRISNPCRSDIQYNDSQKNILILDYQYCHFSKASLIEVLTSQIWHSIYIM
jgi:hypothetical protein